MPTLEQLEQRIKELEDTQGETSRTLESVASTSRNLSAYVLGRLDERGERIGGWSYKVDEQLRELKDAKKSTNVWVDRVLTVVITVIINALLGALLLSQIT